MRGPVNTKIKLTIMRKGANKPIEVAIVRAVIRVKSVRSHAEGDDIGYIRITQFNEQTTDGLKKAISDLTTQPGAEKLKGFVIDLRNNRAACWIRRFRYRMRSWKKEKSSPPAAATPRRRSASMPGRAI